MSEQSDDKMQRWYDTHELEIAVAAVVIVSMALGAAWFTSGPISYVAMALAIGAWLLAFIPQL